jgi:virginiamycin B lyase
MVAIVLVAATLFVPRGTPAGAAEVAWFDLPSADSFPHGLAAGPDGTTWVAGRASAEIIRVAPDGGYSAFGLESGVDPHSIVQGADGAMWFTESGGSRIGRLTIDDHLSEFPLQERAAPMGITVGPDGAMWFTERSVSSIGRVTLDGEVSEWATPTPRAAPLGITMGPDGALWFTETTVNAIGRITTDGSITEFPLPVPDRGPQWITAGPDGALWFTERSANAIGRLTPDGRFSEYSVPTPSAGVNGITIGPDAAIWFTESAANAIGRIDMRGRIVEIPLAQGAAPTGIAPGPDGEIWFSAPGLNRIGRLAPAALADTTAPIVTIVSPPAGSVLLEGEGMIADYSCADEPGGSGLVSCVGPVPDGSVIETSLGSHTFTVDAFDAEGNVGTATHGYVVFQDIRGPVTNQATFSPGRVIPIILELGSRPSGDQIFADGFPVVRPVDCDTGEATGPDELADARAALGASGHLLLQWRTGAGWGGSCRSLVVRLAFDGWSDADAIFKLRFA